MLIIIIVVIVKIVIIIIIIIIILIITFCKQAATHVYGFYIKSIMNYILKTSHCKTQSMFVFIIIDQQTEGRVENEPRQTRNAHWQTGRHWKVM